MAGDWPKVMLLLTPTAFSLPASEFIASPVGSESPVPGMSSDDWVDFSGDTVE